MGGNPITQMQIIDNLELRDIIKEHNDLVIGFCAGAINLSNDEKRDNEIKMFSKKYNSKIFAIPDEGIIVVEGNNVKEYGKIYCLG